MKRKLLGRVSAVAMASAMMVSMFGMSVSAAGEPPKAATITKNITKESNVYAPNTSFDFTITPGTAVSATADSDAIYAGPEGGAYFADGAGTITSTPKATDINQTTVTAGTTQISINEELFTKPGIYRYVVKETTPTDGYDGITYSTEEKYFDVYIGYGEDVSKGLQVLSYTFTDKDNPKVKDDGIFENDYDKDGKVLHDLVIKKTVTGNQGNKTDDFEFSVTINGESGEQYYVVYSDGKDSVTLTSGTPGTIYLSNGETATIYGLDSDDKYTVTETDYTDDGYKTKVDDQTGRTKTDTIDKDTTVIFENNRNVSTPTGIIMNIAPYIVLVAFAAVAALFFLRRRNNREF